MGFARWESLPFSQTPKRGRAQEKGSDHTTVHLYKKNREPAFNAGSLVVYMSTTYYLVFVGRDIKSKKILVPSASYLATMVDSKISTRRNGSLPLTVPRRFMEPPLSYGTSLIFKNSTL